MKKIQTMYGSQKVLEKEKNGKENYFLIYDFIMENMKES